MSIATECCEKTFDSQVDNKSKKNTFFGNNIPFTDKKHIKNFGD